MDEIASGGSRLRVGDSDAETNLQQACITRIRVVLKVSWQVVQPA